MVHLEIGKKFEHKGELWKIIKINRNYFLAINEFGFNIKSFPLLERIK